MQLFELSVSFSPNARIGDEIYWRARNLHSLLKAAFGCVPGNFTLRAAIDIGAFSFQLLII